MIGAEFPLLLVGAVSRFPFTGSQFRRASPAPGAIVLQLLISFLFLARLPMMKKWRRGGASNTQGKRCQRVPASLTKL